MGIAYDKSRSDKYKKYFELQERFEKDMRSFSLEEGITKADSREKRFVWDDACGGVPLSFNATQKQVLFDQTDSHTLVIGPTGSKKTRLFAMPMVRIIGNPMAKESMIVSDPKAEIYNRTSEYLKKNGYTVYTLNLRYPQYGHSWNPLTIPYVFYCEGEIDRAYEFANDIAQNLIIRDMSEKDPFWDNSAGSFFFGLVLLLFRYCKEYGKNLNAVTIENVIKLRGALFEGELREKLWEYARQDSFVESALIGTVQAPNDTRQSILSVFDQKMRLFSINPGIMRALASSSINLEDLLKNPAAIFMIMPDEKTGYHGLVSLFIKQSYEYLIFRAQKEQNNQTGRLGRRLNYILDEFSSLPTISDFPAMITASRSRNIRFTLIVQSKSQLVQRYREEAETIQTNCNNWIFLTSRELNFLNEISALCGNTTDKSSVPILPISMLQRLEKEIGEVLILSGRKKPYIAQLLDIDAYDKNDYIIPERKELEHPQCDLIDLGEFRTKIRTRKMDVEEIEKLLGQCRLENMSQEVVSTSEIDDKIHAWTIHDVMNGKISPKEFFENKKQ